MRVSVIIPVLNEERRIGALLDELTATHRFDELLVVDGGSSDRTVALARAHAGVRVLSAPRGRAHQMNAGAAYASADVLLFLHADVRLPKDAVGHVRRVLSDPRVVAGAFRTWTVCDDPDAPRRWLAPLLHLADVRSRVASLPYGDQALFVRAHAFRRAGGFPAIPLMEDIALSKRLAVLGRIGRAHARVTVSGRRFLERPVFYTAVVNVFPLLYRMGVPPSRLAALYAHVR